VQGKCVRASQGFWRPPRGSGGFPGVRGNKGT